MVMLSKNFYRWEFACKCGCGRDTVDAELIKVLEHVRQHYDVVCRVNSGHRCETHNRAEGGGEDSQHLYGRAADIVLIGRYPIIVYKFLDKNYPISLGLGLYDDFVHVDTRTNGPARWNNTTEVIK